MALTTRTVPTHLHTADKLVDLGLLSMTATQALNLVAAGLLALELLTDAPALPLPVRQLLAALVFVVLGQLGAFCRVQGKSLWAWLLVLLRYIRFPRQAAWRPAASPRATRPAARWHEVTPRLAWPEQTRS
jgi:hypothetical protein